MQLKGIVVGALVLSVSACSTTKASTVAPSSSMEETKRLLDACNTSLEDAQHRLADYGNQQDKNAISMSYYKRRMQAYKDIADRLRGIFTPDKLKIEIRDGLLVVQMPEPVLFGPGQFKLHAGGESTLREMEPVLQSLPKREFLVSGYTDDVPVKKDNSAYQDNWELSALRALAVVRYLRQLPDSASITRLPTTPRRPGGRKIGASKSSSCPPWRSCQSCRRASNAKRSERHRSRARRHSWRAARLGLARSVAGKRDHRPHRQSGVARATQESAVG